jgi:hypothetical protein
MCFVTPRCLLAGIILSLCVSGCSRREHEPVKKRAAPVQENPLIDVVYDAARFYSSGGLTFQTPPDITIQTRSIVLKQKSGAIEEVEIRGSQQKGQSEAVILFHFPVSWLTVEKEQLTTLEAEMKSLSACSRKLVGNEMGEKNQIDESCAMIDIFENSRPGIEIRDAHAGHIKMMLFAGT